MTRFFRAIIAFIRANPVQFARIVIRYGVGAIFGVTVGDTLASDPDVINAAAAAISGLLLILNELSFAADKSKGKT